VIRGARRIPSLDFVIGAGFGESDRRTGVVTLGDMRQRNLLELRAELLAVSRCRFAKLANFFVQLFPEILLRPSQPELLERAPQIPRVVRHRLRHRGGIERVASGNGVQQGSGIVNASSERARMVQARSERDDAIATDAAERGFQANYTAKRGGDADRAAGVGADRGVTQSRGKSRS